MAQRRQIRVSRSLEGEGERPATGYGEPEAGAAYGRSLASVVIQRASSRVPTSRGSTVI